MPSAGNWRPIRWFSYLCWVYGVRPTPRRLPTTRSWTSGFVLPPLPCPGSSPRKALTSRRKPHCASSAVPYPHGNAKPHQRQSRQRIPVCRRRFSKQRLKPDFPDQSAEFYCRPGLPFQLYLFSAPAGCTFPGVLYRCWISRRCRKVPVDFRHCRPQN